jgi:hypothetical protein
MTTRIEERIADLGTIDRAVSERVVTAARTRIAPPEPSTREPRRRRPSRRLAGAVIAAGAVAAAVVALHPGNGSRADAAVLERALVAVTAPPHSIQHIRQVLRQGSLTVATESWQSIDDPGSARRVETSSPCGSWAEDISNSLTQQQWFDPDHDRIVRTTLDPAKVRASWPPLGGPRTEFDPTVPFAVAMHDGVAQVVGATTYEGTPVTHISWPEDPVSDPDGTARNSLYVDSATGAPVVSFWGGGRLDGTGGQVAQQRFLTYEFLPETTTAGELTEVSAHPAAQIMPLVSRAQFDAEFQVAQRLHCHGVG